MIMISLPDIISAVDFILADSFAFRRGAALPPPSGGTARVGPDTSDISELGKAIVRKFPTEVETVFAFASQECQKKIQRLFMSVESKSYSQLSLSRFSKKGSI